MKYIKYGDAKSTTQQTPQRSSFDDMDGMGGDSGTYGDSEKEFLLQQIDVKEELRIFEHQILRGEMEVIDKDTSERKWIKISPDIKPPLNELGVREILMRVMGQVSVSSKLTYRTEEEIYKDMFHAHMSLAELVAKRSSAWNMDINMAKTIVDTALELIWTIISSSRNGFTSINLRSSYSRVDSTRTDSTQRGGRSFLGMRLSSK